MLLRRGIAIDVEAAEKAMWDWYLEWSTIARTVISDRRHLRALGFLKNSSSRSATDEEEESESEAPTDDDASEVTDVSVAL